MTVTATPGQAERAQHLHRLHRTAPLVLPNAWDAGSARVVEQAGAAAIATTSGGHAWSIGLADGGHVALSQVVSLVRQVVAAVSVPVTVDIEAGYGDAPSDVAAAVAAVLDAGAVGINLEDSRGGQLFTVAEQVARTAAARRVADDTGVRLFVNARTDVFLFGSGQVSEAVERAGAYAAAGADGFFVPGLLDLAGLRALCASVALPVNAMTGAGAPSVADLVATGVVRVSAGTALAQAAYDVARRSATELLAEGTCRSLEPAMGYGELNELFLPHG